ncbi:DIP1984 family protein [Nostocaceae cyanobacterium CENA357]|uniref:DIP1984 family protein n=1 Tax=Atlanticothrix silvestris CENA357 TaxID=1725252 RepID=A0A8J7L4F5_9CYAN|nr:DIP1984 family protein [Atlanticothrix silvestris]MBH8554741.1 DIP1984 family protein [Atlanticothrix silvestris CENA357]
MKLAEALVERKAAQTKIGELNERLQRIILVQEGEQPAEQPTTLLQELDDVVHRLEALIVAINRTNVQVQLPDGRSIMAAIAQRDVVRMQIGVLETLIRSASSPQFRTRGSEIKFVVTLDIAQLHRERDQLARAYRELDTAIQAVNWSADLVE